jgi:hypothetical protein
MQWPGLLAEATCAALADCLGADLLTDGLSGRDCATLEENTLRAGDLAYLVSSVEAGLVAVDSSQLDTCLDDIENLGCDVRSHRLPASCELTFTGLVELGESCTIHEDCSGAAFCDKGMLATCPGTCVALQGEGASCLDSDDSQCEDGLVCPSSQTDRATECGPLGLLDDACGVAGMPSCAPGFLCDDTTSKCVTLESRYFVVEGEACTRPDSLCQPGLVCESVASQSEGVCRATVESGAACKRAEPSQCPYNQYCDAEDPGEEGACVDRPTDGEPCLVERTPSCADAHTCLGGTCLALKGPGEACEGPSQCYGEICENGTCTEALECSAP